MSALVYNNHAGTTSDSFSIGKKGIKLIQDVGDPAGIPAPAGSLYVRKDNASLHQIDASNNWNAILTTNNVTTSGTLSLNFTSNGLNLDISNDTTLPGSNGVVLPNGTTSQRPVAPRPGTTRFNTDTDSLEVYNGSAWITFGTKTTYYQTFTYADLSGNVLTVAHNLGESYPIIQIWDEHDQYILPDYIQNVDVNTLQVTIGQAFSSTWKLRVSI